jgi:hypothetical protein
MYRAPVLDPATNEETDEVWGWSQLVSQGHVEYVDTEEEETTLIAMTMKDLALQRDAVRCCFETVAVFCVRCSFVRGLRLVVLVLVSGEM